MRECLLQIRGATTVLTFATQLAVLGVVAAVLLDSLMWVLVGPVGTIALMLGLAAFGPKHPKRKVTPSQFARELENHLLGIDGEWEWDDTTSMAIADPKLDSLRDGLSKFDLLNLPEHREELAEIIVMLRRGEVPTVIFR